MITAKTLQAHPLVAVALDPTVTPEQREEGLAREVRRRIQMARKLARVRLDLGRGFGRHAKHLAITGHDETPCLVD